MVKAEIIVEENGVLRIENADMKFFESGIICWGTIEISNSSLSGLKNVLLVNSYANIVDAKFRNGYGRLGKEVNEIIGKDVFKIAVEDHLGGVLYSYKSKISLENVTIEICNSDYGGGIFCNVESQISIANGRFFNCHATCSGGAIYVSRSSKLTLVDCTFEGCSAEWGGALAFLTNSTGTINDCTFKKCKAKNDGYSIYIDDSYVRAVKCKFNGCKVSYKKPEEFSCLDCEGLD